MAQILSNRVLLKPGKDPESSKSYRPISLVCHLFNLYERLNLNRIEKVVESKLIPPQAGFNLVSPALVKSWYWQNISRNSSSENTTNHQILLHKAYETLKDYHLSQEN